MWIVGTELLTLTDSLQDFSEVQGVDEAVEHIEKAIEENDPVDGFVAFSQVFGTWYFRSFLWLLISPTFLRQEIFQIAIPEDFFHVEVKVKHAEAGRGGCRLIESSSFWKTERFSTSLF